MSVIFGIYERSGCNVTEDILRNLADITQVYAPDQTSVNVAGEIGMGFQVYHTTDRSRLGHQPAIDAGANMVAFDGRLDNHAELQRTLDLNGEPRTDSELALGAFTRWGRECFSHLVGDWALALWSAKDRSLYLSRDHAGTRSLYYSQDVKGTLRWSTYLESFFPDGVTYPLEEEYVARYLGCVSTGDLTPYKGIRAVPPAHYLTIRNDGCATVTPHWQWMVRDEIRFKSNIEYEEQFFNLFKASVERRSAGGSHVVAHLSGGMDSTSIVCMSDHIRQSHGANSNSLMKTISMYDDTEPNWDERPYFSLVENRRGCEGIHIQVSMENMTFNPPSHSLGTPMFPCEDGSLNRDHQIATQLANRGTRAILAGMGGDELLGGVPTPVPELADHMIRGNIQKTLKRGIEWSLAQRHSLVGTLLDSAKFALKVYRQPNKGLKPSPWMGSRLRNLYGELGHSAIENGRRLGLKPSAIGNGLAWCSIYGMLPHLTPLSNIRFEYRYPYLDRDLVDFLFRIPREQLVEPGRRRSLMRRSLKQILPIEILERKRKAYCIRGPLLAFRAAREKLYSRTTNFRMAEYGFIDADKMRSALDALLQNGESIWFHPLMKCLIFEAWLQSLP